MKGFIITVASILAVLFLIIFLFHFSRRNVSDIKCAAENRLADFGYEIIAYEGYKHTIVEGGNVWYQIKKKNGSLRYTCYLKKWDGEYHLYGPKPVENVHIREEAPKE